MEPHYADASVTLLHGDCLTVLPELPDNSVDAVCTDPPYGLEFMGKDWDGPKLWRQYVSDADQAYVSDGRTAAKFQTARPSYSAGRPFQAWCEQWAAECLRILRPGGYAVIFGGTRTFHRLACAVEDAGFEIRDSLAWIHGQGFPKSRNVTADLAEIPACACDIPGEFRAIDPPLPAGAVGAGAGAVSGPVGLAGSAADAAGRIGPQVGTAAPFGLADVDTLDVDGAGQDLPVVLRSLGVATGAEGQQIVSGVSAVEVDPEALRDDVVCEEVAVGSAVDTLSSLSDHSGGDLSPTPALVLPLPAPPSGVAGPVHPLAVGNGHTRSGAVGAGIGPAPERGTADSADVLAVPGHDSDSTAERLARCEACGGRLGAIPQGLGTALKPAFEPIVVGRKPLTGTVAANVLRYGTGALNIDACRIGTTGGGGNGLGSHYDKLGDTTPRLKHGEDEGGTIGRWPANVVLDESQAAALDRMSGELHAPVSNGRRAGNGAMFDPGEATQTANYADTGGASRFFYTAKAGSDERITHNERMCVCGHSWSQHGSDGEWLLCLVPDCWCPGFAIDRSTVKTTSHPTVKPLSLMRWLVRLVTPPGGTILEPFAGSGTTVEAAVLEGFKCIAVEREADYLPLITQRINRRRDPIAYITVAGEDLGLFADPADA